MSNYPATPKEVSSLKLPRSPELMNANDTGLLVVDMQERLLAGIHCSKKLLWNVRRLVEASEALKVKRAVTLHYPERLGGLVEPLATLLANDPIESKKVFSAGECGGLLERWRKGDIHRVLVCGLESHICIQQTAYDLMADGYRVYLAVDAVGSRYPSDKKISLRRLEAAGVILTTTEAAMFELCETARHLNFKKISALATETAPESRCTERSAQRLTQQSQEEQRRCTRDRSKDSQPSKCSGKASLQNETSSSKVSDE